MRLIALLFVLAACACKKPPSSTADASTAPVPSDSGPAAQAFDASAASATAPASARGAALGSAPTVELGDAGDGGAVSASAVVGFAGGAILVYAIPSADKSDVIGRVLDAEGRRRGPARLLRRTSGAVAGLAVAARGGVVWIAWGSSVGSEDKHLAAAVKTDLALGSVSSPITVVHETLDSGQPNHWVHALVLPSGGAIVATRGAGKAIPCMFAEQHPNDQCRAPGYKIVKLSADGSASVLAHRTVDGNPLELAPLVDVGGAVAVRAWAWHGGSMRDDQVLSYDDAVPAPPLAFSVCNPPYAQAWTGDDLITVCERDHADGSTGERCPSAKEAFDPCPRVLRSPADGGAPERRGSLVRAVEDGCMDGHPITRIVRADGSRAVIDPTRPGAGFARFSGWTGKALLETSPAGDGPAPLALTRHKCRGADLVDAPLD